MLLAGRPPAFHWRTLRESGGEEEGGVEGQPGARVGGGEEREDTEWSDGGYEVRRRGWGGRASLADEGLDCTVKVYMSEEREVGVTVLRVGTQQGVSSKSESYQNF